MVPVVAGSNPVRHPSPLAGLTGPARSGMVPTSTRSEPCARRIASSIAAARCLRQGRDADGPAARPSAVLLVSLARDRPGIGGRGRHDAAARRPGRALRAASGFWYELRDESGKALYRRAGQSPIRTSAEILTDDREKPIVREELSDLSGHFVLIAPNLPEASTVALIGTQPRADSLAAPAEELAQFDLQTRRRIS